VTQMHVQAVHVVAAGLSTHERGSTVIMWLAFAAVGLGALAGMRAPLKSHTLSPDSIQRRFYWTGCGMGCVLIFLSQWPNWARGAFGTTAVGLALIAIAFLRTNHIKVGGRIYAAFGFLQRPDRPPALASQDEE
jgi:hypothetical protein